jgi:hypothetical protein
METANHLEADEGWGKPGSQEWARMHSLLELVRREHQRMELSPERREQIRERVLERWEGYEARRRRVRVLVAAASAMLLAGVVLMVVVRARAG